MSSSTTADGRDLFAARELLKDFLSSMEAGRYTGTDAANLVAIGSEIAKLGQAIVLKASVRVEETNVFQNFGHTDAGSFIAEITGEAPAKMKSSLDLIKKAQSHPDIEEALIKGELSESQLKQVTTAAEVSPEKAADLVKVATEGTFGDLKKASDQVRSKKYSGVDSLARYQLMRKERYLKTWVDTDGFGYLQAKMMGDQLGIIKAALEPFQKQSYELARKADQYETHEQYGLDGLVEMAKRAASGGGSKSQKPLLQIRVDWDALVRGHTVDGEICEVDRVAAIPAGVAAEYAKNALMQLIVLKGTKVDSVVTDTRYISNVLNVAIKERDEHTCAHKGCNRTLGLERDHIVEMRDGGVTKETNIVWVCKPHHDLKTHHRWRWVGTLGKDFRLVPPNSPDYPAAKCDRRPEDDPPSDPPTLFDSKTHNRIKRPNR